MTDDKKKGRAHMAAALGLHALGSSDWARRASNTGKSPLSADKDFFDANVDRLYEVTENAWATIRDPANKGVDMDKVSALDPGERTLEELCQKLEELRASGSQAAPVELCTAAFFVITRVAELDDVFS